MYIHSTTFPKSLRLWICQNQPHYGDENQQNHIHNPKYSELLSKRFSSPTEIISEAILFVYHLRNVLSKLRTRVTRDGGVNAENSTFDLTISMEPTPLLGEAFSYVPHPNYGSWSRVF